MAFNLGELLDNIELDLPDSTAQPTVTPQKKGFNLVTSITAYLIGVSEEKFSEKEDALAYDASVFARLDKEEKAKIIRALCRVRTGIEKNYTKIYKRYREEYLSIMHMPEYVPTDDLKYLDSRMKIYSFCDNPQKLLVEVNRLISARINNCKDLCSGTICGISLSCRKVIKKRGRRKRMSIIVQITSVTPSTFTSTGIFMRTRIPETFFIMMPSSSRCYTSRTVMLLLI